MKIARCWLVVVSCLSVGCATTSHHPTTAPTTQESRSVPGSNVAAIGYSGHHNGISLDVVAFTLGAQYIERHFTLDRTWKGTDHAASLEPDGLRRLQRDLHNAASALAPRPAEIAPVEEAQRAKLKWSNDLVDGL